MSRLSRGKKDMSNVNLIERLGADYCTQRMNGTLFNHKGTTYQFHHVDRTKVYCTGYTGTPETPETKDTFLPFEVFDNWKALSWPVLGYRQAAGGQVIVQ